MTKKKSKKKESTLYYFHSVGCAFCKQIDPIVEKLNEDGNNILSLDLSEKENQGLHREIENKYDLRCGTPFLVDVSSGNHICGFRDEDTIKKWAKGEEIPEPPKPKSPAPPFPMNNPTEKDFEEWTEKYNKWTEENNHLPKLQTAEQVIERFKQHQSNKNVQQSQNKTLDSRIRSIEENLDKLMVHLGVK